MQLQNKKVPIGHSFVSILLFVIVSQIAIIVPALGLESTYVKEYKLFREYRKGERRVLIPKTGAPGSFVYTFKDSKVTNQVFGGKETIIYSGENVNEFETHGILSRTIKTRGPWKLATFLKKKRIYFNFNRESQSRCANAMFNSLEKLRANFNQTVRFESSEFFKKGMRNGCTEEIAMDSASIFENLIFSPEPNGLQNCLTQMYSSQNKEVQGVGLNLIPFLLPAISNIVSMSSDSNSLNSLFEIVCKPSEELNSANGSIDRYARPMKIFLPQNCSPEKLKKLLIHEAGGHGLVSLPVDSCQEERFMEQLSSLCGGFSGTLDKDFETQVIESFQGSCKSIGTSLHAAGLGVQTGEKQERLTGGAWSAFAANAAGIEDAVQVQQAAVAAVPRDLDSVKPLALATLANSPVYTTTGRAVPEDGKSYQIVETPEVRRAFDDVERYSQNNVIRPLNTAFGTLNRAEANPRPLAAANTAVGQQQRAQLVENAKELAATRADALAAVGASGTVAELRQAVLSDLLPRATGTSNPAGLAMNAATLARDASLRNSGAVVASGNGSVALGKMDSSNEVGSNVAAGVNAGGAAIASGKMDSSQGLAAQPAATSPGARVPASAISQTAGVAAGRAQNSGQSSGSGGGGQNTSSRAMAVASVLGSPSVQRVEGQTYSAAIELHSKDPDEFRRALDAKNVRLFFKPRGANKVIEFGSKDPKARQLIENGNALELKK